MNFFITSAIHAGTTSAKYFTNELFTNYNFLLFPEEQVYKYDILKRIKQMMLDSYNADLETFYHAAENTDFLSITKLHNSSISIHF
jgi:hypothetical protein